MSTLVIQYSKLFLDIHICVIAKSHSEKILNYLIANKTLNHPVGAVVSLVHENNLYFS